MHIMALKRFQAKRIFFSIQRKFFIELLRTAARPRIPEISSNPYRSGDKRPTVEWMGNGICFPWSILWREVLRQLKPDRDRNPMHEDEDQYSSRISPIPFSFLYHTSFCFPILLPEKSYS